jgi:tRNA pseudouridine55 synthase
MNPCLSRYAFPGRMVLCIDKPLTWTSADVVRKIRFRLQRYYHVKKIKVGHTGTLDPLATGLMLICAGKATRISDTFQTQDKEYIAGIRFGATTPSFDLEQEQDATYPWEHITLSGLEEKLRTFTENSYRFSSCLFCKKSLTE